MTWKVWLIVFKNGTYQLGARNLGQKWQERLKNKIADKEQIFGTQIPHRVIAKTPKGYKIMTPTEAKSKGYRYEYIVSWK